MEVLNKISVSLVAAVLLSLGAAWLWSHAGAHDIPSPDRRNILSVNITQTAPAPANEALAINK